MADIEKVESQEVPDSETLSDIFEQCLHLFELIEDSEHPSNSSKYQSSVKKAIFLLEKATGMVNQLGVFSSNETVEEVATSDLRYLLLPSFLGYFSIKLGDANPKDRLLRLSLSELYYRDFLKRCKSYELPAVNIPEQDDTNDFQTTKPGKPDLAYLNTCRDQKIQQYKMTKEIENEMRKLKNASKLDDNNEIKREYYLVLLKRWVFRAADELSTIKTERTLLENVSKLGPQPREAENHKPLKPVIIVRNELQKKVFGMGYPSHPAMTVDEFYKQRYPDEEAAKAMAMLSLQKMAADPEITKVEIELEKAQEEQLIERDDWITLQHARDFDNWKDENRRGSGNRKNKG